MRAHLSQISGKFGWGLATRTLGKAYCKYALITVWTNLGWSRCSCPSAQPNLAEYTSKISSTHQCRLLLVWLRRISGSFSGLQSKLYSGPPFGKEPNLPYPALVVKEISAVRNENSTHHATSGSQRRDENKDTSRCDLFVDRDRSGRNHISTVPEQTTFIMGHV